MYVSLLREQASDSVKIWCEDIPCGDSVKRRCENTLWRFSEDMKIPWEDSVKVWFEDIPCEDSVKMWCENIPCEDSVKMWCEDIPCEDSVKIWRYLVKIQ